ncbi:MAG: hypothetical protein HC899_30560, partial [Leptolyngbyaceae cyanobacterium SM1_4_3]|nr:hypothetical protein [Leptolyngbyaceae cyanobacterium SM1_4_3]
MPAGILWKAATAISGNHCCCWMVSGTAMLGERLEWNAFAGMALIFVGLAAIDG